MAPCVLLLATVLSVVPWGAARAAHASPTSTLPPMPRTPDTTLDGMCAPSLVSSDCGFTDSCFHTVIMRRSRDTGHYFATASGGFHAAPVVFCMAPMREQDGDVPIGFGGTLDGRLQFQWGSFNNSLHTRTCNGVRIHDPVFGAGGCDRGDYWITGGACFGMQAWCADGLPPVSVPGMVMTRRVPVQQPPSTPSATVSPWPTATPANRVDSPAAAPAYDAAHVVVSALAGSFATVCVLGVLAGACMAVRGAVHMHRGRRATDTTGAPLSHTTLNQLGVARGSSKLTPIASSTAPYPPQLH